MLKTIARSRTFLAAVAALGFGAAALVAATPPAAADGLAVRAVITAPLAAGAAAAAPVITVDHRGPDAWRPGVPDRHGWNRGWHRGPHHARHNYRPAPRPVRVCAPEWQVKKVHDRHGRVVKVIRTRVEACRVVYR